MLLPEITLHHVATIQQAEAFATKPLYSESELSGMTEEYRRYKTSSMIVSSLGTHDFFLTPWMIHFGISLIIGLIVAVTGPSVLTLIRHIVRRGEYKT